MSPEISSSIKTIFTSTAICLLGTAIVYIALNFTFFAIADPSIALHGKALELFYKYEPKSNSLGILSGPCWILLSIFSGYWCSLKSKEHSNINCSVLALVLISTVVYLGWDCTSFYLTIGIAIGSGSAVYIGHLMQNMHNKASNRRATA